MAMPNNAAVDLNAAAPPPAAPALVDPDPSKPWLALLGANEQSYTKWDCDLKDYTDFMGMVSRPSRGWVAHDFATIKGSGSVASGFEFTIGKRDQAPYVFRTPANCRPTDSAFNFAVLQGDVHALDLSKGWKLKRPKTLVHPMLRAPPTPSQEIPHDQIKGKLPKWMRLIKVPPTGWLPWYSINVVVAMLLGLFGYDPAGRAPTQIPLQVPGKVEVRNLIEYVDGKYRPNNLPSEDVVFHQKTQDILLLGIADGHGGKAVAQYFADMAPGIFEAKVLSCLPSASQPQNRANALLNILSDIIAQVDAHALANLEKNRCRVECDTEVLGGDSGAVVALVAVDTVLGGMAVANVGDCSVSLVSQVMPWEVNYSPVAKRLLIEQLTLDHDCGRSGFEGARVMLAGGYFCNSNARVGGHFMPSRVVGDFSVRELDKRVGESMAPIPDLRWVSLSPADVAIVLSSDGCHIRSVNDQRYEFNRELSESGKTSHIFAKFAEARELSESEKKELGLMFVRSFDSYNHDDHGVVIAQIFVEPSKPKF